jgi:hypothetical protein
MKDYRRYRVQTTVTAPAQEPNDTLIAKNLQCLSDFSIDVSILWIFSCQAILVFSYVPERKLAGQTLDDIIDEITPRFLGPRPHVVISRSVRQIGHCSSKAKLCNRGNSADEWKKFNCDSAVDRSRDLSTTEHGRATLTPGSPE